MKYVLTILLALTITDYVTSQDRAPGLTHSEIVDVDTKLTREALDSLEYAPRNGIAIIREMRRYWEQMDGYTAATTDAVRHRNRLEHLRTLLMLTRGHDDLEAYYRERVQTKGRK